VDDPKNETLTLGVNETYVLSVVDGPTATLHATTVWGALRGLETFAQSVQKVGKSYHVPVATITDAPRMPYRGILVDTARHFLNVSTLQRIVDAMEMHKLNGVDYHPHALARARNSHHLPAISQHDVVSRTCTQHTRTKSTFPHKRSTCTRLR
jgi:hypothetical protein